MLQSGYYIVMFLAFLYICANPFIYATKFDPVKRVLVGMVPWKKSSPPAGGGSVEMRGNARAVGAGTATTTRSAQEHH